MPVGQKKVAEVRQSDDFLRRLYVKATPIFLTAELRPWRLIPPFKKRGTGGGELGLIVENLPEKKWGTA